MQWTMLLTSPFSRVHLSSLTSLTASGLSPHSPSRRTQMTPSPAIVKSSTGLPKSKVWTDEAMASDGKAVINNADALCRKSVKEVKQWLHK